MTSPNYAQLSIDDEDIVFAPLYEAIQQSLSPVSQTMLVEAIPSDQPTPSSNDGAARTSIVTETNDNIIETVSLLPLSPSQLPTAAHSPERENIHYDNISTSSPHDTESNYSHSIISLDSNLKDRVKYVAAPWVHDIGPGGNIAGHVPSTARKHAYWTQSQRLWTLATGEWLITAALCGIYAGILVGFVRRTSLGPRERATFNSLVTAVSFFLGVNLAASLRSYAKLLRWLLLAERYRPLSEFDLILSCDSIFNVIKLTLKVRNKSFRYLPSKTQTLCVIWLLINLSMPLGVGVIGLTYNMNSTPAYNKIKDGKVMFLNFSALQTECRNCDLNNVQTWGLKGFNAEPIPLLDHQYARDDRYMYHSTGNGTTQHWLESYDPADNGTYAISFRKVRSQASCQERTVISGGNGTDTDFTFVEQSTQTVEFLPDSSPGPAGLTVWGTINETCGPRSACVSVFIAKADINSNQPLPVNDTARYFDCNNTVLPIKEWKHGQLRPADDDFQFSDNIAQMLAGAIAWSGYPTPAASQSERSISKSITYTNTTHVSWQLYKSYGNHSLNAADMADFVSSFTMKAITAMDDFKTGLGGFQVADGRTPVASQQLDVNWSSAILLFVGIPAVQFMALVIVFCFAHKAIIKDESPLSIAKLYFSLLQKHGFDDKGCMLKGFEIADEMGDPNVKYGSVKGVTGIRHLDLFEEEQALQVENEFSREKFYDGSGLRSRFPEHGNNQSRGHNDFNANAWFA